MSHVWCHRDQAWHKTMEGSLGTQGISRMRTEGHLQTQCAVTPNLRQCGGALALLSAVYAHLKWWEITCATFSGLGVNVILILIHQVFFLVHLSVRYAQQQYSLCLFQERILPFIYTEEKDAYSEDSSHVNALYKDMVRLHINQPCSFAATSRQIYRFFICPWYGGHLQKKKVGPVYHCAAEIPLRGYCSQAWFVPDVLIHIRSQIHPNLPSASPGQRGTNTKLYPSSPG